MLKIFGKVIREQSAAKQQIKIFSVISGNRNFVTVLVGRYHELQEPSLPSSTLCV
jgi:hypothetical protein